MHAFERSFAPLPLKCARPCACACEHQGQNFLMEVGILQFEKWLNGDSHVTIDTLPLKSHAQMKAQSVRREEARVAQLKMDAKRRREAAEQARKRELERSSTFVVKRPVHTPLRTSRKLFSAASSPAIARSQPTVASIEDGNHLLQATKAAKAAIWKNPGRNPSRRNLIADAINPLDMSNAVYRRPESISTSRITPFPGRELLKLQQALAARSELTTDNSGGENDLITPQPKPSASLPSSVPPVSGSSSSPSLQPPRGTSSSAPRQRTKSLARSGSPPRGTSSSAPRQRTQKLTRSDSSQSKTASSPPKQPPFRLERSISDSIIEVRMPSFRSVASDEQQRSAEAFWKSHIPDVFLRSSRSVASRPVTKIAREGAQVQAGKAGLQHWNRHRERYTLLML